jgi:hypothetical protein
MYYCWLESLSWSEFSHFCTPCSNKAFSELLWDTMCKAKCSVAALCVIMRFIPWKLYQVLRTVLERGKWQGVGEFKIWCSHSGIDYDSIVLELGVTSVGKYLPTFGRKLFQSATSAFRLHNPWWWRRKSPSKPRWYFTKRYDIMSQKTWIFTVTVFYGIKDR